MRISLLGYVIFSILFGIMSILYAYAEHEQFYPTVVSLTTSKTHILVIGNLGFAVAIFFGHIWQKLLFGIISDDESREVLDKAKYTFIDICIALTIFRTDLTVSVVCLFTLLLFAKIFHWMAELRVETVSRLPITQHFKIFRIVASLLFLILFDFIVVLLFLYVIIHMEQFGVLVLFTFEFIILLFATCSQFGRFFILLIDNHYENDWKWKFTLMFYTEFAFDVLRLTAYVGFFVVITKNWSFPLHLMRELYMAIASVRRRFQRYVKYKRLVKALETRFPKVTAPQLDAANRDKTCIICRSDIETGIQLPCGHIFHTSCLKLWFQESPSCPTCRLDLSGDLNRVQLVNQLPAAPQQQGANNPAQPQVGGAPVPGFPQAARPAFPVGFNQPIGAANVGMVGAAVPVPGALPAQPQANDAQNINVGAAPNEPMRQMPGRPPHNFQNLFENHGIRIPMGNARARRTGNARGGIPQPSPFDPAGLFRGLQAEPNFENHQRTIENTTLAAQSYLMYHQLLASHYENLLTDLIALQKTMAQEKELLDARRKKEAEENADIDEVVQENEVILQESEEELEDKDEEEVTPLDGMEIEDVNLQD